MTSTRSSQRLVLLATGVGSEPRGAWFEPAHAADLVQAARQGGLHLIEVEAHALRSLDHTVAAGHLMAPGQPSALPPMRPATFNALVALPGIVAAPRQLEEPQPRGAGRNGRARSGGTLLSIPRRRLKVGSIVLASMDVSDGWYEAVILAIAADGTLRLHWRGYPDSEEFTKPVACVAAVPVANLR